MTVDDDADEKWEGYPGHTRAKHSLLRYYLDIWIRMLGSPHGTLRIFDCFAGRGEYYQEGSVDPISLENIETAADVHGSPQLILDLAVEHSHNVGEIKCVFLEKKSKNASILRENLPNPSELPNNINYRVVEGKFQDKVIEQVQNTGGFSGPAFFFIDPFGYSALDYDIVTKLASTEKFEVFINLMAEEVVRWQDVEKQQDAIKVAFGKEEWRKELEEYEPKHWNDKEVEYYCKRLQENGPKHTLAYLVTEENSEAMKYYLVFGTNSEYGMDKMREAMQNCGPGEFAFAPKRPALSNNQMSLDAINQKQQEEKVASYLIEHFDDKTLSFNRLMLDISTSDEYCPYDRKKIRSALKSMEDNGEIAVERITSKTERGLGGDDKITFPKEG